MEDTYNIIPLGENCIIAEALKDLDLRKCSYPFDWITHKNYYTNTNIMYNCNVIEKLMSDKFEITDFLGNTFSKLHNNIWFPHDNESDVFDKYTRRFQRLRDDISTKTNVFVLLTRHFVIDENAFDKIILQILSYNKNNKIIFIHGSQHKYLDNVKYQNIVTHQHILYDITKSTPAMEYDYFYFRPMVKKYLYDVFVNLGFSAKKDDKLFRITYEEPKKRMQKKSLFFG